MTFSNILDDSKPNPLELTNKNLKNCIFWLGELGKDRIDPLRASIDIAGNLALLVEISPSLSCQLVRHYSRNWPFNSGNKIYPVPATIDPRMQGENAENPFIAANRDNLWDTDEYGKLRRNLCLYIATELQTELATRLGIKIK